MDVAITGASGLIGTALSDSLRADGHRVVRLVRGSAAQPDTVAWNPEIGTIEGARLEELDAIVHLAGEPIGDKRWTDEQKLRILQSRVKGTELLARTIADLTRPPRVFVSGSAIGYYGNRGDEALTETSTSGNDFAAEVAVEWERASSAAAAVVRTVNIRTGIVLARQGGVLKKLLLPFSFGLGGRTGPGDQYMSWIDIDDEVGAIRFIIDHDEIRGPVNLTAPNPATNREFTSQLGKTMHRPTGIPTPLLAVRLRYGKELVQTLLEHGQRVEPAVLQAAGYPFEYPNLADSLHHQLIR
jgi:uncharacterized protein (TIGR01777 family)